jgi:coenzyme F420-0:L-glutamate ligase/coenzyme F420-1:gamma-L-glutamate ligase
MGNVVTAPTRISELSIRAVPGVGEVVPGTDLGAMVLDALARADLSLQPGDVLVLAQKIVSKAEGRYVDLRDIQPSPRAQDLARITGKDPRLVEVILGESTTVLRARPNVLITRHRLGLVMAQAGVDRSNVAGSELALLLPVDPDRSAAAICAEVQRKLAVTVGVIISDSFGRPWRQGTTNVAIGVAGTSALWDRRGELDRHGRRMEVTQVAWADAAAAAAGLVMGEGAEGTPVILVRGLHAPTAPGVARDLIRPLEEDMFQ